MQESTKPIVAALKGGAIGGGCELALAADIRVADTTLKMALPEILYGVLPDTGGTQMMTALVGPSRAKYLVLTGRPIDAATAPEWGAVRSEEHTSELQSLMRNSYAVFCLKKKKTPNTRH